MDGKFSLPVSVQSVREDEVGKAVAMATIALNVLTELNSLGINLHAITFDNHATNVVSGRVLQLHSMVLVSAACNGMRSRT